MFLLRRAILNAARTPRPLTSVSRIVSVPSRPAPLLFQVPRAPFSAAAGLSKEDIHTRVVDVLKSFEKVDPAKVQATSSFTGDLGLDSLDAVEVVMAVEEEFGIEIPDTEADEIQTVQHAVEYIAKTPEAR